MRISKTKGMSFCISAGLFLLFTAVILSAAARMVPGFAQWYSTAVYPVLQGSIGRLSGIFPFSVGEALCIVLPVLLLVDIAINVRKHQIRNTLRHLFIAACILFFLYSANCGVNYYRDPFVDPELYRDAQFSTDDLEEFCEFSVSNIQKIYGEDVDDYPAGRELADNAIDSMKNLAASGTGGAEETGNTSALAGFYPRPKELTVLSRLFSKMGVSGIYCPFTIEANINGEMVGLEKPFTACHELSHLKGFMNEGEANYIGWLACITSEDKAFNRSGWLISWIYAGNSLFRIDPERYYELKEKLPEEAIRELDDNTEFWATHETKASEVQDRVNDAYLKSNGQNQGIQSYGQLTTLMLLWYEGEK